MVAIAHEAQAKAARERLVERYQQHGDFGDELTEELHASMVAITGSAFAIDGFYGTVSQWIDVPDATRDAWKRNGTSRHARIFETLKQGFDVGRRASRWSTELKWLFEYRDANVHFEEIFRDPYAAPQHPVVPHLTAERAAYTVESGRRAVDLAVDVLKSCVDSPRANAKAELADVPRRFGGVVGSYVQLREAAERAATP
jgi:hypothetical protein